MSCLIVESADPITLVGAGQASMADLHEALTLAPGCVAVDGGAALAQAAGAEILAVVGDLDSLSDEQQGALDRDILHPVTEQTSTDFEKALMRVKAPVLLGVGFTGGRMDHQLAAMHALLAFPVQSCILLDRDEVIFLAPPHLVLPTREGDIVSLFPLTEVTGKSAGLLWPIEGLVLSPGNRIGTSNCATGEMELSVDRPGLLVILPRRLLGGVMRQLAAPERARWPSQPR